MGPVDEQNIENTPKKPEDEPEEEPTQKPEEEPTQKPEEEPTQKPEEEPTQKPEDEPTQKLEDEPTQKPKDTKNTPAKNKSIKNLKRVEQGKRLAEWNKANKQRLLQEKNIDTPLKKDSPQTKNVLTKNAYIVLIAGILGLVGAGLFYRTADVEVEPKKITTPQKDDLFEM